MKRCFTVFLAAAVALMIPLASVLAGGPDPSPPNPHIRRVMQNRDVKADVARAVHDAVRNGGKVMRRDNVVPRNLPKEIHPEQAQPGSVWQLGDILFFLAKQQSSNVHFEALNYGEADFFGVLVSVDDGSSWQVFYRLRNPDIVDGAQRLVNVVGLSVSKHHLFLDVIDDNGAGSGEGHLSRFRTHNGGKRWVRTACTYFMPDYYNAENFDEYRRTLKERSFMDVVKCTYP